MKRIVCVVLAAICLAGVLAGCGGGDENTASVTSVGMITGHNTMVNSFAGKVVSGQTEKIENDNDRKIAETYVEEGDIVSVGDVLFEYDLEDMQLSLEKLQLELQQMQQTISDDENTISSLQKQMSSLSASEQTSITLQISERQTDIREQEYKSTLKQKEIDKMEENMENAEVKASINGRIMSVKDLTSTTAESDDPYITIMDISAYRVEGQVNEMNIGNITVGMPVIIRSRVDSTQVWSGVIESIDLDDPQSTESNDYYSGSDNDEYTTSSKYNFYVTMDDTDGMILGQHVYIEPDTGMSDGLYLDESYIVFEDDGTAYVWAAGKNTLEKRTVTVGEYNADSFAYEITSGLDYDDYIAFPSEDLHEGQKVEKIDDTMFAGEDIYDDSGETEVWDESYEDYEDYEDAGEYEQDESYEEYDAGWDEQYASDTDLAEG